MIKTKRIVGAEKGNIIKVNALPNSILFESKFCTKSYSVRRLFINCSTNWARGQIVWEGGDDDGRQKTKNKLVQFLLNIFKDNCIIIVNLWDQST